MKLVRVEDFLHVFNPIWRGGDNFVLHPKVIPITSIWVKLHKNVIRYVLEIYFPSIFQQNQNYQQVTWPPYDVIMEFAINSMVKLSQNQKCCNFVKNWYIRTKFYQEVYFKDCKTSLIPSHFDTICKNHIDCICLFFKNLSTNSGGYHFARLTIDR